MNTFLDLVCVFAHMVNLKISIFLFGCSIHVMVSDILIINVHSLPLFHVKSAGLCFYSAAVRQGIVDMVKRALGDRKVKSLVICGQNGVFCGGINMFMSSLQSKTKQMRL